MRFFSQFFAPRRRAEFTNQAPRGFSLVCGFSMTRRAARAPSFAALVAVLALLSAPCASAQAPTLAAQWNQLFPSNPPPARYLHALTYDAGHRQVVLFGGFTQTSPFYANDTWLWNATTWTEANPSTSPAARAAHAMTYDAAHGNVIMFGGFSPSTDRFGDTWLWDGTNWTQANPANSPSARDAAVMVYDAATGNVLLFGGSSESGALSDTWTWNGTTWTALSPANSPSARADYSMAYDPATGNVVLFGGLDANGNYLNDTWIWNGTTWTQQSPANSPPVRDTQGMAYDAALGEVVMWGGENSGGFLNDTWAWNGSTWTQLNSATSPGGRYAPNAITYDGAQNDLVLFSGQNSGQVFDDTWTFTTEQNFGNVNVCSSGAPAPCSNALTLTYTVPSNTTFGTPQVVTQGAAGLDFALAAGSTCTGTVSAGSTCTVNVTFTPGVPGLREGAVELFSSANRTTPLVTTLIYGTGNAPLAAFSGLTPSALSTGSQTLTQPEGVAVDAVGDLFIANNGSDTDQLVKVTANGSASTVGNGLNFQQTVAVDGAGDVFVGQFGPNVIEIPVGCTQPSCQLTVGSVSTATAVAVDAMGDVFIGDSSLREVFEVPAASPGTQTVIYNPGGSTFVPAGLAVDPAGDLYIADSGDKEVLEIPATGYVPVAVGNGWKQPNSVTLDAAGDLYVADSGLQEVVEIPAGCASSSCQIIAASAAEPSLGVNFSPFGVAVDSLGDIYISDSAQYKVDVISQQNTSTPPFPSTGLGNAAGNQSFLFENIGNQTLSASPSGLYITNPSFPQEAGSGTPADCASYFSLAPAADCNISINFAPEAIGPLYGSAIFYDNALNNPASAQSLEFTGTGTAYGPESMLTVTLNGTGGGVVTDDITAISCNYSSPNTTGTCSAEYSTGAIVQLTAGVVPGSTFVSWGGACASFGAQPACVLSVNAAKSVTATFDQGIFGSANVCPGGNPSGCVGSTGTSFPVILNFTASTTFSTIQVVTQGATGLDFQQAVLGSTCSPGTYAANSSCIVKVEFTPTAPGLRLGAVQLLNGSTVVSSQLIYGIAQGSEVAFGPTVSFTTPLTPSATISFSSQVTQPPNLSAPLTTDAAGNLYETSGTTVQKLAPPYTGSATTVATGFANPRAAAIDGAGNLYVADENLGMFGEVMELPPGCVSVECATVLYAPTLHPNVVGVAVDPSGNVFIADDPAGVIELPANGGTPITLYNPGGNSAPESVAVDAFGDVFVADEGLAKVVELPPGCTIASCQITVGTGWGSPYGVAVDAAGDVIVADVTLTVDGQAGAGGVVEVPTGCASSACQILLLTAGAPDPYAVTLSATGQLFVATDGPFYEINLSQPPQVDFGSVNEGLHPVQTVTLQNIGNEALISAANPDVVFTGSYFLPYVSVGSNPYCNDGPSFTVAPGATCDLGIIFEPTTTGLLTGTAVISDNVLSGSPATQTIPLSGTGVATTYTIGGTVSGLTGTGLVLQDNGGDNLPVSGNGSFTFPTALASGSPYSATVFAQPTGQNCSVTAGSGNVGNANVTNVQVNCSTAASFTLALTSMGTGSGTVTSNPGTINCNIGAGGALTGTCSNTFASGTSLTLTANALGNSTFVGWGGVCSSAGANLSCNDTINVATNEALTVYATFVAPPSVQQTALKPITAGVVYGQGGNFTTGTSNNGGVTAGSLSNPWGIAFDPNGNLYVADRNNNRVLFYPAGSTTATRVYGQNGSFTSTTANLGGISADSLNNPYPVAVDSSGNLYVGDGNNNRVLFYPAGSTTATRVYGQNGSFTSGTANNGGITANSLQGPGGLAVDSSGNLYIEATNRILFFPAGSTTATRVYGQGGSFTSQTQNLGGVSASSIGGEGAIALDASGNLYYADQLNHRVLFYPNGSTTATRVYGQNGSFTSSTPNNGGISANSLDQPSAVAVDASGNLYVTEYLNNRVLFYPAGSTTATRVYGQGGSFTSNTANSGGISANSVDQPVGVAIDPSGNLYVSDVINNRVLEYGPFGNINVCPTGQNTPAPCTETVTLSYYAPSATTFGGTGVVTQGASGLDFSLANGGTCTGTVAAAGSCTVNVVFAPVAPGLRAGAAELFDGSGNLLAKTPVYGVGQAPAAAFGPATQTVLPASGLNRPSGLALDGAGDLFIADYANNQIVKLTPGGVQYTVPTSGLSDPRGVAVDGAGDLFISDAGNDRVVEIPAGCTTSGCQVTVPTSGLSISNGGLAVDGAGDIFIADTGNARVVEVTPSGVQTTVPASGLSGPFGVAVDAAGDVFIADTYGNQVVEVTAGGVQKTVPTVGVAAPEGVWVDAAGDVFVADSIPNSRIVEVPAGGGAQITVYTGSAPEAVLTDGVGDVFIADTFSGRVVEINGLLPPSLSFVLTNEYSTSADSPQLVSVQNVGNKTLTGSLVSTLGSPANFIANAGSTCGSSFSLAPGASCNESYSFTPQATGYLTGTAAFSDNTMNLSSLVALQTVNLTGNGGLNGQAVAVLVPNVVGMTQAAGTAAITSAGLTQGTVSTAPSNVIPSGSVVDQNPVAGTQVNPGSSVRVLVSTGPPPPTLPNPLLFENNYFVTGDYASAGVALRGTGVGGTATGTITIPDSTTCPGGCQGVPDGADIIDAFLYWETLENTPSPSATNGTFNNFAITGQQIGSDLPYTDGSFTGTLRVYRADVNTYFPVGANGVRFASGGFKVSLPDGGTALPLTEGASLVVIYRVLSPNFPLKAVVLYDGSAIPTSSTSQNIQGFYDAVGGASGSGEATTLFDVPGGGWNNGSSSVTLGQPNQYNAPLAAGNAYAAVILSTPVANSDNDGILDSWKAGPGAGDFYAGSPGYYDVKTGQWVPLPGAKSGEKDLFVQLDYMCGAVLSNGSCDPNQENLFPSPDANGNDPLAMVTQAFAADGIVLHLEIGNAVAESTCTDGTQLCEFPSEPGVVSWKNSIEFSKLWPRNLTSCAAGGDCSPRFPYGQKDSYHYVLFGHSLAIPAWNTRYGTLTAITVSGGVTTITTADRGPNTNNVNYCPSRFTISGVLGDPSLNGIYNTTSCPDSQTIILSTPGVPNWSYPNNTLPEPVIGLTSGTVTSISGYSDLGGSDSAVTLALWETAPNQDMSKRANVIAGTLFHEIGHTLGLTHGGLYYQTPGSYIPTFDVNCKPNYQSVMNYLFQLDGVGPNAAVAYSNQTLATLSESSLGSVTDLTDTSIPPNPPTFATTAWYTPTAPSSSASPATLHCDGTPLTGDTGYRVDGPVTPVTPAWTNGQNIAFDGVSYTQLPGYNDVANIDLRQVGATGGEYASLANVVSFGSTSTPLNIGAGGNVTLGSGGTVTLGSGGNVTLGSGGNVTLGSGGTITMGSGGNVTLGSGGNVTLGSAGTITLGSGGNVTLGSGGNVTLGSAGTITLGSGGTVTLGSGGTVTLGSGGTIALGSGGSVTIPATGGSYTLDSSGGTITLGSGGTVTLGSGGNVTLGSGGTIALGSGGNVTLGSGGNVTLGSGGTIALGSGGNVTLGSGGNVTLGSGGTITLGSGGTVTLGSGGNVTLGSGGTVTQGSGGADLVVGAGGTVALGSGGTATVGAGGTVTLGSGGNVTLGSGGTVALGSGGTVALGSGGTVALGSGGTIALGSGGTVTLGSGGNVTLGSGGNITLGSGGVTTNELTYLTANSVVRPPSSPTETPVTTPTGTNVTVNWTAPAFGVVQTYTISRSVGTGMPVVYGPSVVIGSVSGVNGNPPATTFTDINPPAGTLAYTISTTLLPVPIDPTQRQSAPSAPAVVTVNQTVVLGSLPSSVLISASPLSVTATAESNGAPNGLQVNFSTSGSCSIASQSVQSISNGGVSSASVTLSGTGSCTITASQPGTSPPVTGTPMPPYYNAANPASGTFMILPANSTTKPQTISWASLPNVQYGNMFSLSATSTSGETVAFTSSGPCKPSGTISGVGLCSITASAPANGNYSAASVTQSFTVYPVVLTVTANSFTISYGQALPALTDNITGFVNGDPTTVVTGTPGLSTTATANSSAGSYPITVSTGTLSAANYDFLYVNGTLTIQGANQSALTLIAASPLTYNTTETISTSGGSSGGAVTYSVAVGNPCTISANQLTATSGTGACMVTATMAGNGNYNPVSSTPVTVTLSPAPQTITFTTRAPSSAAYNSTFTVAATGGASGNAVAFTSSGVCTNSGATYTMTSSSGTCSVIANQAGNTNYSAATQVTESVTATGPALNISPSSVNFGNVTLGSITTQTITVTNNGTSTVTINEPLVSLVKGGNSNEYVAVSLCPSSLAVGSKCTITIAFVAGPYYGSQTATLEIMDNAPGNPQAVPLSAFVLTPQTIAFTTNPPASAVYGGKFTVAATGGASGNPVTFTSSGACSNSGATYAMTSGTGTCSVIANQAGNSTYAAAAQMTRIVTATLAAQTITFTTSPPASAAYKSTFSVAATGGGSGNTVTFMSSGACTNSGATYTMTASTGSCSVIANQAGNSNYAAAAQVTKTVTAALATQTITFTTSPPTSAAYKSTFTVAATGGGSGNAVTFKSSGACTNSGAKYTITATSGTCSVIANQAGNSNYMAAPQLIRTVTAIQ